MELPQLSALNTQHATDMLILASALIIAFGLGLNWERYLQNGNYPAIILYTAIMFYAAVYFYRQL